MSKTPRTDSQCEQACCFERPLDMIVNADFARRLETELVAKTAELESERKQRTYFETKYFAFLAENKNARADAFEEAAEIARQAWNDDVYPEQMIHAKADRIRKGEEK